MARKVSPKKSKPFLVIPLSLAREIWAVVLAFFGLLLILAFVNHLGVVGESLNTALRHLFGIGVWILPVLCIGFSFSIFTSKEYRITPAILLGAFFMIVGLLGIIHTIRIPFEKMAIPHSEAGGTIGVASSAIFRLWMGDIGTVILLLGVFFVGVLLTFQTSLLAVFQSVFGILSIFFFPKKSVSALLTPKTKKSLKSAPPEENEDAPETLFEQRFEIKRAETKREPKNSAQKTLLSPEEQDFSDWEKPSLDLLKSGNSEIHIPDAELMEMGKKIVEKLANFGISVRMKSAFVGPTVTQFALEPNEDVKLSRITGLKNELALALSAEMVRIEAPIPGKNLVGIETPNPKRATVFMREILESTAFEKAEGDLRLAFGKDVSGNPIVESLAEMPHLLIAGATGSGKSVGMNAFLISLLFEYSPEDLRFILIDPKRVELMPYNGIPHLLTPVITEANKALSALKWCVSEMMRRLGEFSKIGARNIAEYNEKVDERMKKKNSEKEEEKEVLKKLPKIVIVIDELADLMMREYKKDTEAMICRIAQMARAVGMHLIIATQRPSVDVITGLIKANIPTRISFAVTSSIDSRTVLDSVGAEDLLGKGDMLFTNPKLSRPKRIQGIYISGEEIERVANRIKITMGDKFFFEDSLFQEGEEDSFGGGFSGGSGGSGDSDDLMEEALEMVRSTGKASASLLQRRLSVGYARAARLLDIMEEKGYIGPARGAKPREIYL
ncbi:MAG: DNA translocase FtsK [Candidatus Peregrinibacteria bacterium]